MRRRNVIGVVAAASASVLAGVAAVVAGWPSAAPATPVAVEPVAVAAPASSGGPAAAAPVATTAAPGATRPGRAVSRPIAIAAGPEARTAEVPERRTERFSMVSITWDDPAAAPRGAVQVRTRTGGKWSPWRDLETVESRGPDTAAERTARVRGGTGALWVGESDGVGARLLGGSGADARPLPSGLRLNLIDPGRPAPGSGGRGGSPAQTPREDAIAAAMLRGYVNRADWGADESIVRGAPQYADAVKVQFVHHTAGTNEYACEQSAALIRGIYVNQVQNMGWDDVGYNVFVDKCGTVYEGRRGGIFKPVIGAHTYGFNSGSTGVAVLGDYRTVPVPRVVQESLARLAAAKLTRYGLDPAGTSQLVEGVADGKYPLGTVVTFARIAAHRDGFATECPGDALYAQLPAIRALASRTTPPPTATVTRPQPPTTTATTPAPTRTVVPPPTEPEPPVDPADTGPTDSGPVG